MATTVKTKKLLHRKSMEMCTPSQFATAAGSFICGDEGAYMPQRDCYYYVLGVSSIFMYNADEDGWMQLPASGITGTFGAGACGDFRTLGMLGGVQDQPVTAGTTTTLVTNKTIVRNLVGCKVQVVSGVGRGYSGTVVSNTVGGNSTITVTPANSLAFDSTTVFRIWSGSLWFFCPGAGTVGFAVYDRATNVWTGKSVTGLPTTFATSGQLISTESSSGAFETGTSTGGGTVGLSDSGKAWATNAYTNAQVRITAGTGIGQIRTISSNTPTALTISIAWTTVPDNTSQYVVEGNDDNIYLMGNGAVALYKYSISGNTWSTLAPTTARSTAPGAGSTGDWINSVTSDSEWAGAQGKTFSTDTVKQNGRYIYSFRGGSSNQLDIYDIAGNKWINALPYGNTNEAFTTGSCSTDYAGMIYIQRDATGRIFKFDVAKNSLDPLTTNLHPQGAAVEGDKLLIIPFIDTGVVPFLYVQQHARVELLRMMLV